MDFDRARYLVAVAEERSISRAAEKCFISQPALTKSINTIEANLGVKLFDRASTPIRLTYAGERYIEGMQKILAIKRDLDQEMEDLMKHDRGHLRIGIPTTRASTWLPGLLSPFCSEYPHVEIQVLDGTGDILEQSLLNDKIDLVVMASLPLRSTALAFEPLLEEQLMLVLPGTMSVFEGTDIPEAPMNHLHYVDPRMLDGQPFITLTEAQGLHHSAKEIFQRHGISPISVMQLTHSSAAYLLASQGHGFSIAPAITLITDQYEPGTVFCTMDDPPATRTVVAAYRADKKLSVPARRFLNLAKDAVAHMAADIIPHLDVVHDIPIPDNLKATAR